MGEKKSLGREFFLAMGEHSGLDIDHSHLEDLYAYLEGLRPVLRGIEDLDLTGFEPFMPSLPKKEEPR